MEALNNLVRCLDETLSPCGFRRHKRTWNRRAETLIDVIDLQVGKSLDSVFVNVGVMEPSVYARSWLTQPPEFACEPDCTVRSRLGFLIGDRDVSWPLGDPGTGEDIARALGLNALPFLDDMHEPGALERYLDGSPEMKWSYPPPKIYSALLKYDRGEKAEAHRLLRDLQARANDVWSERVGQVMEGLGLAGE